MLWFRGGSSRKSMRFHLLILYKYAWQSWSEWCDRYDVSKTRPSVGSFTKYLVQGKEIVSGSLDGS